MECAEKVRLVGEHHVAALAYSRAAMALNRMRAISTAPEGCQLRAAVDEARSKSFEARGYLERHQAAHGC
jgi:hypothetical protein